MALNKSVVCLVSLHHLWINLCVVEPCVFSLEKDRYHVNETDGTVRIGVVKTSGSIPSGESVMVTVTPREGAGQVEGAGVYLVQYCGSMEHYRNSYLCHIG